MKALVNTGPGRLTMRDVPTPSPGRGQVRVHTMACGICATDLEMIAGWDRTPFGAIPGHEWSGIVDAVGDGVDPGLVGQQCVAENVLSDGGEVGFEHPGGYAEWVVTEAQNVYALPDTFPLILGALIEPLAVAVRGLSRMRLDNRTAALVTGDGPLGLLLAALLQRNRVKKIVLTGGRDARLAAAVDLGVTHAINYHEYHDADEISKTIRNRFPAGLPNAIEASGRADGLSVCLASLSATGALLVIGDYGATRADFQWNELLHRELTIIGSNASAGGWPEAVRLACTGAIPLDRLLTHRFPVSRYAEAIETVRDGKSNAIKVVLEWTR